MRCLVTGATGYIGGKLCAKLARDGHDVVRFVRSLSENMLEIFHDTKPDVVLHIASLFVARHKNQDIVPLIESNITYPTKILDAMTDAGIKNFVNIGTAWQNFDGDGYNPSCLYAATKQAFIDIMKFYEEAHGIKAVTLKFFETYGSDDPRPKVLNLLKKLLNSGENLKMSPGEQEMDFVHVDDVVRAVIMAAEALVKNEPLEREYVVSSRIPIKLKNLASLIEKISNKKLNIEWGGLPYREREIMTVWNGGKWLPGWESEISLENGLREIFEK